MFEEHREFIADHIEKFDEELEGFEKDDVDLPQMIQAQENFNKKLQSKYMKLKNVLLELQGLA